MGWFRDRATTSDASGTRRMPHTILTASGRRLDLKDRKLASTISGMRSTWQTDAWDYRELVGELGVALIGPGLFPAVSFWCGMPCPVLARMQSTGRAQSVQHACIRRGRVPALPHPLDQQIGPTSQLRVRRGQT